MGRPESHDHLIFQFGSAFDRLFFQKKRIDNPYNHGVDAAIRVFKYLTISPSLAIHEDSITNAGMGAIQGDEVFIWGLVRKSQWLHNQQPALFKMQVADGGDYGSNNFA
jgi:hypothetical protein